jgi:hypothetical protein
MQERYLSVCLTTVALTLALAAGSSVGQTEVPKTTPSPAAATSVDPKAAAAQSPTPGGKATSAPPGADADRASKSTDSISLHFDAVSPIELKTAPAPDSFVKTWVAPSLGGLFGLLGAVAAVWMGVRNTKSTIDAGERNTSNALETARTTNEATLWQKANETELKEIQDKLDGFYGPFLQMSSSNKLLAHEFRNRQPDSGRFRLIEKIFDKKWKDGLQPGDRAIVKEICQNAADLEKFILEKAAMVDEQLLPYLSRASAHFRILRLAHAGDLGEDPTNFLIYLYPYQLDNVLALQIDRLRARCEKLRAAPYTPPGSMAPLVIPRDKDHELPPWPSPAREPLQPTTVTQTPTA